MANEVQTTQERPMTAAEARKRDEVRAVAAQAEKFSHEAEALAEQIRNALPRHIPAERFNRVLLTAVQQNPDLLIKGNRRTLWNAALKCASDGLYPDGREGALVLYGEEVQWMPMVAGIRKKIRNSGEVTDLDVQVVREGDEFAFELGDNPFIRHMPKGDPKAPIMWVYSVATFRDGTKSREVMSIAEVEQIRTKSRAKSEKSPWHDPVFYPEMVKKTCVRRHGKRLPMSTDADDLIRRDDHLYDLEGGKQAEAARPRLDLSERLNKIAGVSRGAETLAAMPGPSAGPEPDAGKGTGATSPQGGAPEVQGSPGGKTPGDRAAQLLDARNAGFAAKGKGVARRAVPGELREDAELAASWQDGWDEAKAQG